MPLGHEVIESRFGFHKATLEGAEATKPMHAELRKEYKEFAQILDAVLPDGREKSLAMTALEDASMWSHKAIAQTASLDIASPSIDFQKQTENLATVIADDITKAMTQARE